MRNPYQQVTGVFERKDVTVCVFACVCILFYHNLEPPLILQFVPEKHEESLYLNQCSICIGDWPLCITDVFL